MGGEGRVQSGNGEYRGGRGSNEEGGGVMRGEGTEGGRGEKEEGTNIPSEISQTNSGLFTFLYFRLVTSKFLIRRYHYACSKLHQQKKITGAY